MFGSFLKLSTLRLHVALLSDWYCSYPNFALQTKQGLSGCSGCQQPARFLHLSILPSFKPPDDKSSVANVQTGTVLMHWGTWKKKLQLRMLQLRPSPHVTGPPKEPGGTHLCGGGRRPRAGPPQRANISNTPAEHPLRAGVERNESVLRAADVIRFGLPLRDRMRQREKGVRAWDGGRTQRGRADGVGGFFFSLFFQMTLWR